MGVANRQQLKFLLVEGPRCRTTDGFSD